MLDAYWRANPELHDVPIYYASKLATRALRVYQTYTNMMNQHIRARADESLGSKRPLTNWVAQGNCTLPAFAWTDWGKAQVERERRATELEREMNKSFKAEEVLVHAEELKMQ